MRKILYFFILGSVLSSCKESTEPVKVHETFTIKGITLENDRSTPVGNVEVQIRELGSDDAVGYSISNEKGEFSVSIHDVEVGKLLNITAYRSSYSFEGNAIDGLENEMVQITQASEQGNVELYLMPPSWVKLNFTDTSKAALFDYINISTGKDLSQIGFNELSGPLVVHAATNISDTLFAAQIKLTVVNGDPIEEIIRRDTFTYLNQSFDTLNINYQY